MKWKNRLGVITSCISFVLGWLLVIIGFFTAPVGEVSNSVLWILGQALLYCGSFIGIADYCKYALEKIQRSVEKK